MERIENADELNFPEMEWREPPEFLYHGTTADAWDKIRSSGGISRMERHAVQMYADCAKAWQSVQRRHSVPVVLKIDAARMSADDIAFGVTENGVWCCDAVPAEYIIRVIDEPEKNFTHEGGEAE